MRKILNLAMTCTALFLAKGTHAAIWGSLTTCVGGTTGLSHDSASTGYWSSGNLAVATIGSSTGVVTGVTAGTAMISWNGSLGLSTAVVTVTATPVSITGGTSPICVGSTATLSSSPAGGSWVSTSPYVATVGASTGIVTGSHAGTATINYNISTCSVSRVVTVVGTPADSIIGPSSVCIGGTAAMTTTISGGTWSSSSTATATISSSGVVTGVSAGTAWITYWLSGTCPTYSVKSVVVTSGLTPGSITGTTSVGIGSTTSLSNSVAGGTWSSSTPSVATISGSGVVTGVSAGTTTITYSLTSCASTSFVTAVVTVTTPNCIAGKVRFTTTPYYGPVKVWLIKYDPSTHMLSACDSTYVYASGDSVNYSFCGMGTDSFRVKAHCDSPVVGGMGYLPTYHTSSAFWNTATVIYHTSGTYDSNKDIIMGYGAGTSGPGFVAGDVTTGANKGTAGAPAANLLIFCVHEATGTVVQQTVTDAAGHYSFSNLPVGEPLKIYPELINYATTPFSSITLTSGTPSMTVANFVQRTISLKIEPILTVVKNTSAGKDVKVDFYPNPANGKLNVKWNTGNQGVANITMYDAVGREVMASTIDMNVAGQSALNVSTLAPGMYLVKVRTNLGTTDAKVTIE